MWSEGDACGTQNNPEKSSFAKLFWTVKVVVVMRHWRPRGGNRTPYTLSPCVAFKMRECCGEGDNSYLNKVEWFYREHFVNVRVP